MSVTHDKHWAKLLFDAGQSKHFNRSRRRERRIDRHMARAHCHDLKMCAAELAVDELDELPVRYRVRREWKEQGDYLAPLLNFLESRVGTNWDDTYSILATRTNRNSSVGDHLWLHLWQHVKRETHKVEKALSSHSGHWRTYYIDHDGILRRLGEETPRHRTCHKTVSLDRQRATAAFGEAKIVMDGEIPHWGYLARVCPLSGRAIYRQGHRLPTALQKMFAKLSPSVRRAWTYFPLGAKATTAAHNKTTQHPAS